MGYEKNELRSMGDEKANESEWEKLKMNKRSMGKERNEWNIEGRWERERME